MTYWNNKGLYTKLYEELNARLVPEEGRAPTPHGELLSATARVYYDWFNNGGCNYGLPRFQLALYTIRDWSEEIDAQASRIDELGWPGTRAMLDKPIEWSRSEGSSRNYGLDDVWEKNLERLVDAVILVVGEIDAKSAEPQLVDMQEEDQVKAYATTYDEHGDPMLVDVPLTDPPGPMKSDDEHLVIKSEMRPDFTWEHIYRERDTGTMYRMIVSDFRRGG